MSNIRFVPGSNPSLVALRERGYDILFISHAEAILAGDFPQVLAELESTLQALSLPITEIIGSGGGETKFTQRLRRALDALEWPKHTFVVTKTVDGVAKESVSHEIDHVRRTECGVVALEIEWNNRDPSSVRLNVEQNQLVSVDRWFCLGSIGPQGA